jgi:4-amino-4-deoxy-L-arabinose transferase-like glycosyltransferase
MKTIEKLKKDKLMFSLLILVIVLGLFLRFNDFTQTRYWNDDLSTVPSGILWYYPHSYFPGLSGNSEPPLGNIFIGLGCISSGEDFSGVSQIQPGFYPGRPSLIAEPLIKSELNCHIPMYIFGLLFFIAIILLSLTLFNKYSSLYVISFFAFFPFVLRYSRWIHVDTLMFFFVVLGHFFLYKAFIEEKYSKKERLFFILTFSSFALATATKLTGIPFFIFGAFILFLKYKEDIFSLTKENYKKFLPIIIPSAIISVFLILLPFKLNPKNIFDMFENIRTVHNPYNSGLSLHFDFYKQIFDFFLTLNIIDMVLALFSIFIVYKLIIKKKSLQEKFILSLFTFYIISIFLFNSLEIFRIAFPYTIALPILMGLAFSNKEYSLLNIINKNRRRLIFILIILVYISYSFSIALYWSPYFLEENPIACTLSDKCFKNDRRLNFFSTEIIADELNKIMADNETFFPGSGILYYYVRPEDDAQMYNFDISFQRQIGRTPGIVDYLTYYRPNGRIPRYLLLDPYTNDVFGEEERLIKESITPKVIVKNRGKEILYIYDMFELTNQK